MDTIRGSADTPAPGPLTVLVVDDDAFVRRGMRLYLAEEGFDVIEAADAQTAWRLIGAGAAEARADVAVVDIRIPCDELTPPAHSHGLKLAGRIKRAYPEVGVVLFSAYEDRGGEVIDLVRGGARGLAYKLKGCPPESILEAVRGVRAGRVMIDPEVANARTLADEMLEHLGPDERCWVSQAVARIDRLSPRELDILSRLGASLSIERIAGDLAISDRTVENHVAHIYDKLSLVDVPSDLRRQTLLTKASLIHELSRMR